MPRLAYPFGPLAVLAGLGLAVAQPPAPPLPPPIAPVRAGFGMVAPPTTSEPALTDEEALKEAGLSPTDGVKLVEYLRLRTASEAEQGRIKEIISRFAADNFDDRLAAAEELTGYGPSVISLLRAAERDPNPEIAYRAGKVLRKMEKVPHATVAAAAVRAVVRMKPPGAAAALLGFLPLADTDALADDIRTALVALAVRDGAAEPALVAALTDPSPLRRATAYVALVEGGPATERIRIKDAYAKVKEAVRADPDPDSKFRGLWALVMTTREKEFVPDLIGSIPQLPRGRIWQLEEFLLQLAGEHPPGGRFGRSAESLAKTQDAWGGWWAKKGGAVDLVKLTFHPRIQGITDLIEHDQRGFGMARIVSLGPDLKEKWRLTQTNFHPFDARMLPDGHVMIVEQNFSRVTERELNGTVTKTQTMNQPVAAEPLADGGRLYVCRVMVTEHDKDGKSVWTYTRPMGAFDIVTGRRLPGGDTVLLINSNTGQGVSFVRLDSKGKEVGKPLVLPKFLSLYMAGMDVIGENTILVSERDKVCEYDLKTGKAGWSYRINQPTSVQRLPNGNTLIASPSLNKVIEVDPDGEVTWEYQSKDEGLQVVRAYRR